MGHGFVRVDVAAGLLVEEVLHLLLHQRHARLAADQNDIVDLADIEARILQGSPAGAQRLVDQFFDQRLQFRPAELQHQVLGPGLIGRDVGQIHFRLLAVGQLNLGLLRSLLEALQGQRVVVQIDAVLLLEFVGQIVDYGEVEIFAAEEGIAIGRKHLELVLSVDFGDLDDRDVEGAATEVVDCDPGVAALLVEPVGQCGGRGLVDDALDFQPGNAAGVLGCLALRVVEIGRYRDHRIGHGFAQVVLGGFLHLLQNLGRDLRRRQLFVLGLNPGIAIARLDNGIGHHLDVLLHHVVLEFSADQALDGKHRVARVGHRLSLGILADENLAVLGVGDDGGRRSIPLGVLDDPGIAAIEHGDARIGRTQINSDDLSHFPCLQIQAGCCRALFPCLRFLTCRSGSICRPGSSFRSTLPPGTALPLNCVVRRIRPVKPPVGGPRSSVQ